MAGLVLAMVPFLYILWVLYRQLKAAGLCESGKVASSNRKATAVLLVTRCFYPIVYLFPVFSSDGLVSSELEVAREVGVESPLHTVNGRNTLNTALWILAGLLAAAFAAAGTMKLVTPRAKLAEKMAWTKDVTDAQVKLVGAIELAGAIGLVLPALLDIAPVLVPIAAIGLALTMVGAVAVHLKEHEGIAASAPAIVLGALCILLAWGRLGPHAF